VADVEAFQSAHSFSTGISVYGPWAGKLSNSGEELKLYKPDTPEIDIVPYILVDSVDYKDSQAWSLGADGEGYLWREKAIPGLGSDSDNWQTSPLDGSPGRENGSSSTNCFIATAAFGSPMEREVKALRDFRDRHLLNSSPGHAFVHTYYKYSPTFAAFIARHDSLTRCNTCNAYAPGRVCKKSFSRKAALSINNSGFQGVTTLRSVAATETGRSQVNNKNIIHHRACYYS